MLEERSAEVKTTEALHPLLQSYYAELDPEKRQKILEEYLMKVHAGQSAGAEDYRKMLFAARHINKKRPGQMIDRFLWNLITLLSIHKTPGLFPKRHKREVLKALKEMQMDERPLTDPACEEILYLEYRNAIHRYYISCDDLSYGRTLFGMVVPDAAKRAAQRCADIWGFSYGIARLVGAEEEMSLLCRAAEDEYCALVPDAGSLEEAYRRSHVK